MKRFFYALLAALALTGCQKAISDALETGLVFTSEKPATRTEWNGETIIWSAGDAISVAYAVSGEWVGPNLYPSTPLAQGGETAQFTVPGNFPRDLVGAHHFYAIYPAVDETDFSDAPDVNTTVPEIQTPKANSYDPAADIMVAESCDYRSMPSTPIALTWTRITAHADITLKNINTLEAETAQSVTLQAQSGAELTGPITVDLNNPLEYSSNGTPRLTVLADNVSIDKNNELHFWASILPVTLTELTVTLVTDKATYRKTFSGIDKTFTQNARNILGINMSGATRTAKEQYYVKVTTAPADWTGDYLIVNEDENKAFNGALTTLDATGNTISVSITDGKIKKTAQADAARFTIARSGSDYSIQAASGMYIGNGSNSNGLTSSSSALVNKISYNASEQCVNIVSSGGAYLRYNDMDGQKRFRYYKSSSYTSQKTVQLYKLDGEAGGGSETPTVTTGDVSGVSQTRATLSATFTGEPTYGGFEWGFSADALVNDSQADDLGNGSFTVNLEDLGAGITYYYRAYIGVMEKGVYQFYYGEVRSFTTLQDGVIISGSQPGWFEVPLMDIEKSGQYLVNATDPSLYYAWHICAGGEMAANGNAARNFTVCYSADHHSPMWVAAPLHNMFKGSGRHDAYQVDPKIPSSIQLKSKSTDSGCNKGHMLGSADRNKTVATNHQVFYYSNIAPQLGAGFNTGGGGWNLLEDFVDDQYCSDTLYVVIGCYYDTFTDGYGKTATPRKISFGGRSDVSMPTMFYYLLMRTKRGNSGKSLKDCTADEIKCAAFVRTHTNDLKGQKVTSREMKSIADIEQLTGFTFFPNVPNAPKTTFKASDWGL